MSGSLTFAGRRRALAMTWGQAGMPATLPDVGKMTFEERARAGGRGRTAALSDKQREESARRAANAAHRPAALARRIVRAWPTLSADERAEVLEILRAGTVV